MNEREDDLWQNEGLYDLGQKFKWSLLETMEHLALGRNQ